MCGYRAIESPFSTEIKDWIYVTVWFFFFFLNHIELCGEGTCALEHVGRLGDNLQESILYFSMCSRN